MPALKADIITQLKKELLVLQGFKPLVHAHQQIDLGTINHSFPNEQFPLGANHEFICKNKESVTASSGFIAGILSPLLQKPSFPKATDGKGPASAEASAGKGAVIWVSSSQIIFPPALVSFGIDPASIIFIRPRNQKEINWTIEEALKCEGLTAVVGETSFIDMTISRRLQLAAEQSKVTGFLLRHKPTSLSATACVCRWQVEHLKSETTNELPGVGYSRLKVELLKVRNGKAGKWNLEWNKDHFNEILVKDPSMIEEQKQAV